MLVTSALLCLLWLFGIVGIVGLFTLCMDFVLLVAAFCWFAGFVVFGLLVAVFMACLVAGTLWFGVPVV